MKDDSVIAVSHKKQPSRPRVVQDTMVILYNNSFLDWRIIYLSFICRPPMELTNVFPNTKATFPKLTVMLWLVSDWKMVLE
jgi:hypothetical protein